MWRASVEISLTGGLESNPVVGPWFVGSTSMVSLYYFINNTYISMNSTHEGRSSRLALFFRPGYRDEQCRHVEFQVCLSLFVQ